jgi:hypothetical protein
MTTNAASDVTTFGFINIASGVNNGEPYCEDFNEQNVCGQGSNTNACPSAVPGNYSNFPTFNTTCGDGKLDPYEDCDPTVGGVTVALPHTCAPGDVNCACVGGAGQCTNTCRCQ